MPKISDLESCGLDRWNRPIFKHKKSGLYYCFTEFDKTLEDALNGNAELHVKGKHREDEPSHPVKLEDA